MNYTDVPNFSPEVTLLWVWFGSPKCQNHMGTDMTRLSETFSLLYVD